MAAKEYNQKVSDFRIAYKSIPFKDFLNTCKGHPSLAGLTIDGVIFKPLKEPSYFIDTTEYFHTYGVRAHVIAWDLTNLGSLVVCQLDYDVLTDNLSLRPAPPNQAGIIFDQTWDLVVLDYLRFYKITGGSSGTPLNAFAPEFDLVYIDISKFCELAGIARDTSGNFFMQETGNYYPTAPLDTIRGFEISRAAFDFDYTLHVPATTSSAAMVSPVELGKARTLKFNPVPVPELLPVMARPAVAYQLGIPCPPVWRNGVTSKLVERVLSKAIESQLVPDEPSLPPDPPPVPSSASSESSFIEAFRNNKWARGLSIAALLLLAVLVYVLAKGN